MRAIVKILRAQTSEHLSKLCEQIQQRPNFASTLIKISRDRLIPLINAVVLCDFKQENVSFDNTGLWYYMNSVNRKIILYKTS